MKRKSFIPVSTDQMNGLINFLEILQTKDVNIPGMSDEDRKAFEAERKERAQTLRQLRK